jgi:hypothetical protein
MTRFTAVVLGLVTISLLLAGQVSAVINQANIMGAWLFDEGSGDTTTDSSPNGNHGNIVGPQWVADGVSGSCLEFSGVADEDNYVDCGAGDSLNYMGTGEFTITAWVKVLTNDDDWHNLISKKVGYNNTDMGWMAWLDFRDAGAIQLRVNDGSTVNDNTPNAPDNTLKELIQNGEWHHIAWVITEPGTLVYYLDGVNKGEGSFDMTGSTANDVTFRMGNSEGNSKGLHCLMDEVGVFNVTLTEGDIQSLMNNGMVTVITAVSPSGKLSTTWAEIKK